MGMPGPMELLLIFGILVLIFGASKLSGIGKGLGEGIRNFKKGLKADDSNELEAPKDDKSD
ncbi:MAG: twin-arginine translocase TatA/TatE family subunit [Acidobacteria bacterium]|nr:MAG: twin-arginine translocase TatA/TatE family subunit [Acidobacteriota bacterium]